MFTDRIEILSHGSLPFKQTIAGFFEGKSSPRCKELADIFLQLRISERSGRGILHITKTYGKDVFDIEDSFIKVTIPFSEDRNYGIVDNDGILNKTMKNKEKIYNAIKSNSKITTKDLMFITSLSKTSVQNYIKELSSESLIEHVGPKNGGYWKILK